MRNKKLIKYLKIERLNDKSLNLRRNWGNSFKENWHLELFCPFGCIKIRLYSMMVYGTGRSICRFAWLRSADHKLRRCMHWRPRITEASVGLAKLPLISSSTGRHQWREWCTIQFSKFHIKNRKAQFWVNFQKREFVFPIIWNSQFHPNLWISKFSL